jgi:DNA repair exonuclease SbcCD ATPase subunit|tara:strand:- start:584 stop:2359 length:1776 start_codon:yes stop_codon:yes gene_type:complete
MLTIKELTVKNFMSVGNQAQAIDFSNKSLVLVIGENMDLGGDDAGARNGTGKTTIINALSYVFFGEALTNIRRDNLVNKTNEKGMMVCVKFIKNGVTYTIERGRKPQIFRFYANDIEQNTESNEAQGENRETQSEINKLLGMTHSMFKNIIALNTYTQPFLSTKQAEQREIIEQLLGITLLSQKADLLKEKQKATKQMLTEEKMRIDAKVASNEKIQESIESLQIRSNAWAKQKNDDIASFKEAIAELEKVDSEIEIEKHKKLQKRNELQTMLRSLEKEKAYHENSLTKAEGTVAKTNADLEYAAQQKCPTCEQELLDDKHTHLVDKLKVQLTESTDYVTKLKTDLAKIQQGIDEVGDLGQIPDTYYDTIDEAYNHKGSLKDLQRQLKQTEKKEDTYAEQIEEMKKTAIQKIDYDKANELEDLHRHQEFLYKLLTAKDSFIRTRIIEQNLTYLNQRLAFFLGKVKLPHTVTFQSDLTVRIEELGRELDFDNLSRGERNRLILSLSWAFRDVWESLYQQINLLFIDELVDAGMDISGVESSMAVLKDMSRTQKKNIFLISHKDELVSRVNSVLKVVKENGFTNYANDVDIIV